jgi:hypothetical protein
MQIAITTRLIACNMIHDEVSAAMEKTGTDYPVEWVEEGLHFSVKKLHDRVQQALDAAAGCDRVLLAFGMCGNMIEGLRVPVRQLIMPNVDDCISFMLYPYKPGKETGVYYLTRGWIHSGKNAWNDRERLAVRFGEKKANRVVREMLDSYHSMSIIETGAYPPEEIWAESRGIAEGLNLKHGREPGSTEWIQQLLTGPWDNNRFLCFEQGAIPCLLSSNIA